MINLISRFAIATIFAVVMASTIFAAPPLSGAIFTTDITCTNVNVNIYDSKNDVYLDGGPAHQGSAGLPDGAYYVQVTEPNGTLLGTSIGSTNEMPIVVTNGEFDQCYQLSTILIKASNGLPGYDSTTNLGGEYKVWVSTDPYFTNSSSKTDNFKVKEEQPPQPAKLEVIKFYDANANGVNDDNQFITGWKIFIQDHISYVLDRENIQYVRYTPVSIFVDPDKYIVTEVAPIETNWMITTTNPVTVTIASGETVRVEFGNLCLGQGGGLTLGFWSNKNGQALIGCDDLAMLSALKLRNADGTCFNPSTYLQFRCWILGANATNMAYMLSAQLAAMELNVFNGKVKGDALVYAPGAANANHLGFITVNALMAEANVELGLHPVTLSGHSARAYQESLKNAIDAANNNKNFVQPVPGAFSFPE